MGLLTTVEFGQAWVEAIGRMGYDTNPRACALTNRAVRGPVYRAYRRRWDEQRRRSGITARSFLSDHWWQLKDAVASPRMSNLDAAA
jgi:hypothetical protein